MHFRSLLLSFAVAAISLAGNAKVDAVNHDRNAVAAHGYDVVAYFTDSKPVKGSSQFVQEWMGNKWLFASDEHRAQFAANPEKYAPQYGGYCAWAVGHNYTADTDPEAWSIVDGKLYLNYNKSVQGKWTPERSKWIEEGNRNWSGLKK